MTLSGVRNKLVSLMFSTVVKAFQMITVFVLFFLYLQVHAEDATWQWKTLF